MTISSTKQVELVDETESPLKETFCPHCTGQDIIRINSYIRDVQDLGTIHCRKLLRFESITLKCKSCGKTFLLENENVLKGSRYTKAVLEVCLLLAFERGFSAGSIEEHMEMFYGVSIDRTTVLKWENIHGKQFCEGKNLEYKKNLDEFSGFMSLDGTFSKFQPQRRYKRRSRGKGKKKDSWLHLTRFADGTLLALWDEEKMKTKF